MGALIVGVLFVVIMFLGISIHCWKMYKRSSREKRRKKERMQLDLEWEPYLLQLLSSTALFHENNLKSTWQFNRHRYWLSFRHYTMLTVWLIPPRDSSTIYISPVDRGLVLIHSTLNTDSDYVFSHTRVVYNPNSDYDTVDPLSNGNGFIARREQPLSLLLINVRALWSYTVDAVYYIIIVHDAMYV